MGIFQYIISNFRKNINTFSNKSLKRRKEKGKKITPPNFEGVNFAFWNYLILPHRKP